MRRRPTFLIWLLPLAYVVHDAEEFVTRQAWLAKHGVSLTQWMRQVLGANPIMPIQTMSSFLVRIIKRIQATHQFGSLCVVAHSMGSLVARSFVGQYEAELPEHPIRTLVTIAGPFTGIPFASWGLRMSPSVVPSWYDISPDSEFLAKLYRKPLSERVEYHLLFAFDDSGDSDSVVYLLSQLRSEAQGEAELVRGYRATHVGALRSDALAAQVLRALDRGAGNTSLALAAPRPPEPKVIH